MSETGVETGDICDRCDEDFGLSGNDCDGGWNSRCVHCGNNTYTPEEEGKVDD